MNNLIDGRAIAEKINAKTMAKIAELKTKGITPKLEVILVGDDKASEMYDRMKGRAAEKAGMDFFLHMLPATTTEDELVEKIHKIQTTGYISGLIIQLPLPEHLYTSRVLNAIDPSIDVDFLTDTNLGKLIMKTNSLIPPTPGAVITILRELGADVAGKNVTIIGMGALVGKPLAVMLINDGASVTTCNSRTKNIKEKCLAADIIVTGVGKKDLLRGDMVTPGAIVVDTGISFDAEGKVYGDVNVAEVGAKAAWVTPTPGGVGPITVARLLWNTALCAENNFKK